MSWHLLALQQRGAPASLGPGGTVNAGHCTLGPLPRVPQAPCRGRNTGPRPRAPFQRSVSRTGENSTRPDDPPPRASRSRRRWSAHSERASGPRTTHHPAGRSGSTFAALELVRGLHPGPQESSASPPRLPACAETTAGRRARGSGSASACRRPSHTACCRPRHRSSSWPSRAR